MLEKLNKAGSMWKKEFNVASQKSCVSIKFNILFIHAKEMYYFPFCSWVSWAMELTSKSTIKTSLLFKMAWNMPLNARFLYCFCTHYNNCSQNLGYFAYLEV